MFDIRDRVIVLTGATGALGGAIALSLAKAKVQLIVLGRNQDLLEVLLKKLTPFTSVQAYVVNVMDRDDLIRVKKEIVKQYDRIDVLINAVGGNLPGAVIPDDKSVFDLSESDFDDVVDLNLKGTLLPSLVF